MKNETKGLEIQAVTVCLLLAFYGVGWFFTRSHGGRQQDSDESMAVSAHRTKTSERSAPDPGRERRHQESISLAAQKWYEELLEKFPQMKPTFRDVPDAQNGFLQFLLLAESLKEPKLPADLRDRSGWNAGKFKAWLAGNKDYRDQILRVAELPDQSIKGLDLGRLASCCRFSSEFGNILSGSACLAFEEGDQEAALRYARAAIRLGGHLTYIEAPSMLGEAIAEGCREKIRDSFRETIMPALSNNPQALASWREALVLKEAPAGEYARVLTGEWNVMIRSVTLPALLGGYSPPENAELQISDTAAFFDAYTPAIQKLAANLSNSGPDRLDLSQCQLEFPESGIDAKTLKTLHVMAFYNRRLFEGLGAQATRTAMLFAAVAVQLGEEPAVDPVSGKPFQWDPKSRTLSPPAGVEGPDPITLR